MFCLLFLKGENRVFVCVCFLFCFFKRDQQMDLRWNERSY